MKRKTFGMGVAFLLLAAIAGYFVRSFKWAGPARRSRDRYNVVMIVSDALRQDVLGCYGGAAWTPNIDWLARNGVLFENAYSTSPWTAPSAVSMFTGSYATTYGFAAFERTVKIFVPDSEFLLSEALRECGYEVIMRIENVQASLHNNFQGFEVIPDIGDIDVVVPEDVRETIREFTGRKRYRTSAYRNSFLVLRHLLEMPSRKNFFLLHWILDPHEPYDPINKFKSRIDVDKSKLAKHVKFYSSHRNFKKRLNKEEQKYMKNLYIAEVESVDERVGFMLKLLKYKGLLENTYIIFTSDHGEQFGEHGKYGHGGFGVDCNYYDVLLRVPLIISGPKLPKGKRVKSRVTHLDLAPTIKDLLGLRYRDHMQGHSYKRLFNKENRGSGSLYFDDVREHDQRDALLKDDFKLICSKGDKYELFDLLHDPDELSDIADSHAELVEAMAGMMDRIRKKNKRRLESNLSKTENKSKKLTDEERKELLKELRALGYVN